ncbi:MAG: T9SS type A sorting domain-containing protein, partial [Ignavibacteriales bacterium]|nr:T9SS type A sorting domain-containing protein [Ignavibacteriales bacterium]
MNWTTPSGGPTRMGYQIWRATGQADSTYQMVASLPGTASSYADTSASNDVGYCYYIVSVGDPAQNTGAAGTKPGALMSNRYYTQTYELAYKRVAASPVLKSDSIRIVPNPYMISARSGMFLYPGESNKIVFKNVPAICTIKIYSELGELITTIEHTDMTASQDWFQTTSSKQIVVSGVYIVVITTPSGEKAIKKLIVIR